MDSILQVVTGKASLHGESEYVPPSGKKSRRMRVWEYARDHGEVDTTMICRLLSVDLNLAAGYLRALKLYGCMTRRVEPAKNGKGRSKKLYAIVPDHPPGRKHSPVSLSPTSELLFLPDLQKSYINIPLVRLEVRP